MFKRFSDNALIDIDRDIDRCCSLLVSDDECESLQVQDDSSFAACLVHLS
jgi:hypothetical protein